MTVRFVRGAGGVRLAYRRRGSGKPVVLVQGLGLPGSMWLALPAALARTGHLAVTPDNRGTGFSDVPSLPYTMRALAMDLAAVIDDLDRGPVVVVGISLGGMIAQHLALRFADRVAGLVLAATTCGQPYGTMPSLAVVSLLVRSMLSTSAETRGLMQRHLVHPDTLAARAELFGPWDRELSRYPFRPRVLAAQLIAAGLHSTGHILHRIGCPTEVVTGEADEIIPPQNSVVLARRIPGAALTVVPRSGHVFPMEQPGVLPAAIGRIWQRIGARELVGPPLAAGL